MNESATGMVDGGKIKKVIKSVAHWVLFIVKTLVMLALLPLGLLYVWVRWRIARHAFVRAARAAGMDKSGAVPLARELSPSNLLKIINRSGGV